MAGEFGLRVAIAGQGTIALGDAEGAIASKANAAWTIYRKAAAPYQKPARIAAIAIRTPENTGPGIPSPETGGRAGSRAITRRSARAEGPSRLAAAAPSGNATPRMRQIWITKQGPPEVLQGR